MRHQREAGRELDARIEEVVFGAVWSGDHLMRGQHTVSIRLASGELTDGGLLRYSVGLAAAMSVVEEVQKLNPGWRFGLLGGDVSYAYHDAQRMDFRVDRSRPEAFGWHAEFFGHIDPDQNYGQRHGTAQAATPAHAICLAALAALEAATPAKAAVESPGDPRRQENTE